MEGGKLEHEGKVLSLENVDEDDDGPYYCQATSEAGEADPYRFNVYVEGKENFYCLLCLCFSIYCCQITSIRLVFYCYTF